MIGILQDISLGSFSEDIGRLLQLYEEEDDATSPLTTQTVLKLETQPEPNFQNLTLGNLTTFQDVRSYLGIIVMFF